MNIKGKKEKNQVVTANILEKQELLKKAEVIRENLTASTWRELETNGKFDKNAKLSFISEEMLILGCDIGSETHYLRAIDTRGRELSKGAFSFENNEEGFKRARDWAVKLAAEHGKSQIVLGLEPTGHYWFCLAAWMVANGISVVQVNPYAVKQTKEIEDNSQLKDDRKDPKLIANLVKDGNYGMPYLPEKVYAQLRRLSMFRDQLNEDRIRMINRMHRELKICFPEYTQALGKMDGAFSLELLKKAPLPEDMLELGEEGICTIWHEAKLRGRGYSRAKDIIRYAKVSVGIKEGAEAAKAVIKWCVRMIQELNEELNVIEEQIRETCRKIPHAEKILKIEGIGETILAGILAQIGDITRFDDVKEIQKLSGLGLVACSSGKHKGETRISHRGRKLLRYWLVEGGMSVIAHAEECKELHTYYTTREENPLKKKQSVVVVACKLLRIIFMILKTGADYDPKKMKKDIRHQEKKTAAAA